MCVKFHSAVIPYHIVIAIGWDENKVGKSFKTLPYVRFYGTLNKNHGHGIIKFL
jgi:hypothetical protein